MFSAFCSGCSQKVALYLVYKWVKENLVYLQSGSSRELRSAGGRPLPKKHSSRELTGDSASEDGGSQELSEESSTARKSRGFSVNETDFDTGQKVKSVAICRTVSGDSSSLATCVVEEDENDVWAKLIAIQLKKMDPYKAAELRLQIDSLVLKAKKSLLK